MRNRVLSGETTELATVTKVPGRLLCQHAAYEEIRSLRVSCLFNQEPLQTGFRGDSSQVFHQKQQVGQRKAVLNQELLQTEVRGDSSQVFYQKQQVCPSLFGRSYCDY